MLTLYICFVSSCQLCRQGFSALSLMTDARVVPKNKLWWLLSSRYIWYSTVEINVVLYYKNKPIWLQFLVLAWRTQQDKLERNGSWCVHDEINVLAPNWNYLRLVQFVFLSFLIHGIVCVILVCYFLKTNVGEMFGFFKSLILMWK